MGAGSTSIPREKFTRSRIPLFDPEANVQKGDSFLTLSILFSFYCTHRFDLTHFRSFIILIRFKILSGKTHGVGSHTGFIQPTTNESIDSLRFSSHSKPSCSGISTETFKVDSKSSISQKSCHSKKSQHWNGCTYAHSSNLSEYCNDTKLNPHVQRQTCSRAQTPDFNSSSTHSGSSHSKGSSRSYDGTSCCHLSEQQLISWKSTPYTHEQAAIGQSTHRTVPAGHKKDTSQTREMARRFEEDAERVRHRDGKDASCDGDETPWYTL